jgi:hypothetical protein
MEEKEYYWVDAPIWREPSETLVPSWWRNFLLNSHHMTPITVTSDSTYTMYEIGLNEIMNHKLKPFGGEYFPSIVKSRLRFDSEAGFTFFLLKWA